MGYIRAEDVLPKEIVELIQGYVDGECIYIPRSEGMRKEWGSKTDARSTLADRNERIYSDYVAGNTVAWLSEKYFLSVKSIQRIIREYKKSREF